MSTGCRNCGAESLCVLCGSCQRTYNKLNAIVEENEKEIRKRFINVQPRVWMCKSCGKHPAVRDGECVDCSH